MGGNNSATAICRYCGAEYHLFTIFAVVVWAVTGISLLDYVPFPGGGQ